MKKYSGEDGSEVTSDEKAAPAEGKTFKQAFREARNEGKKTFEWEGKKYTTELKGEKKSGSSASQSFPNDANMESAASVMSRGRASTEGSGSSPLEKYTDDKAATAARNKRSMDLAIERAKAGIPERRSNTDIAKERLGPGKEFRKMAKGGSVSSASKRADGCAQRGKTKGRMV
jgi:hypothetical protein